jgi:two-component system chemotaxis response regulator CheB
MPGHDLIVIGGSAGATQALQEIVANLPKDLPAAILVVVHTAPTGPGFLANMLDRSGPLPAERAQDGRRIEPGRIYVAPPNFHLIVKGHQLGVVHGPRENGFRPAVDPLFRTAARAYGARVVGVVLSGGLDDGTEGLLIIKNHQGMAVVQDPSDTAFPSMPASAIAHCEVDMVLPAKQIGEALVRLANTPVPEKALEATPAVETEPDVVEVGEHALQSGKMYGDRNGLTCPECGGALGEESDGNLRRFRCHVGHRYSEQSLMAAQDQFLESALWAGVRALEESAALRRRLARRSNPRWPRIAGEYIEQAKEAEHRAAILRGVVVESLNGKARGPVEPGPHVAPDAKPTELLSGKKNSAKRRPAATKSSRRKSA